MLSFATTLIYKKMKRIITLLAGILLLTACSNKENEAAGQLLEEARTHFEQGDYDAARACIDSLRKTYPNIVEARKGALKLHQEVELKAAQDEMTRTDSVLQQANKELEALQKQVDEHKAALKATPEELTQLTRKRIERDSIRTQFETLGAKIRYIHQKQKEASVTDDTEEHR